MSVIDFKYPEKEQLALNGLFSNIFGNRDDRMEVKGAKKLLRHDKKLQNRELRNERRMNQSNIKLAKWEMRGGKTFVGSLLSDLFSTKDTPTSYTPAYKPQKEDESNINFTNYVIGGLALITAIGGGLYYSNKHGK